jgi:hypothetical protein
MEAKAPVPPRQHRRALSQEHIQISKNQKTGKLKDLAITTYRTLGWTVE